MAVNNRLPPAKSITIEENFRPRPVSVTMPTMMPAAAHVVAALSTPIEPSAIAAVSFLDDGTHCCPLGVRPMKASTPIRTKIDRAKYDSNSTQNGVPTMRDIVHTDARP